MGGWYCSCRYGWGWGIERDNWEIGKRGIQYTSGVCLDFGGRGSGGCSGPMIRKILKIKGSSRGVCGFSASNFGPKCE